MALQVGLLLNVATSLYVLYVDQEILAFVEELRLRPDTVTEADGGLVLDHFADAAGWERGSELIAVVSALLAIRVVREVRSLVTAGRA